MTVFVAEKTNVAAETFGDEAVIVNFVTGKYFSLRGSGRLVWQCLQEPATVETVAAELARHFGRDPVSVQAEVAAMVARLAEEGLVVEAPANGGAPGAPLAGIATEPYVAPALEAYDDLQELIALDPIHEVDPERGWPNRGPTVDIE